MSAGCSESRLKAYMMTAGLCDASIHEIYPGWNADEEWLHLCEDRVVARTVVHDHDMHTCEEGICWVERELLHEGLQCAGEVVSAALTRNSRHADGQPGPACKPLSDYESYMAAWACCNAASASGWAASSGTTRA